MASSRSTSSRYVLNFKPQLAQIGLKSKPLPTLPNSWLPSGTRLFDFSPDSDPQPPTIVEEPFRPQEWIPLPHQKPPEHDDWFLWLLMAGRGAGKTDAMAHYVNEHVMGPPCSTRVRGGHRIGIVAPTLGDAADACVRGPSGLMAHNPDVRLLQQVGGQYVIWPNGAVGKLFSCEDERTVDRLRAGGNRCLDWWEELAAWPKLDEGVTQALFGLRVGASPRVVASTTPRPRPRLLKIIGHESTYVRTATTDDNPHLDIRRRAMLYEDFGGTRIGRQELGGELLTDTPGSLWNRAMLDDLRRTSHPDLARVVVAIDPSGGSGDENDEQGIVVAGKGVDGHAYVLSDASCRLSPDGWGKRAVNAFHHHKADRIVAEANFGGAMVEHVVRTVDRTVAYKAVSASRGKRTRAEPVAALYEQGKVHHIGGFSELEDQLCTWTPDSFDGSPDRLDALVWAITDLMLGGAQVMVY